MKSRTILLVEDNPKDELLTRRSLKRQFQFDDIVVAHDGQEALDLLFGTEQQAPISPTLVLLDLRLPKIGGHEILKRIRNNPRTRLLPVVILTSSDEEVDILNGYEEGANSYVKKPIMTDDFAAAVQNLGLFWLTTNIAPTVDGYDDE
ncbi:MAG: response regulator [Sedimenticola sp.]